MKKRRVFSGAVQQALIASLVVLGGTHPAHAQKPVWGPIKGPTADARSVCATDNGSGSAVTVFLAGDDHNVYYNATLLSPNPEWEIITWPGAVSRAWFSGPVACTVSNGELFVFARIGEAATAIPIGTVYMANTWRGQSKWTDWVPVPGGGTTNTPLAAVSHGGSISLFKRGDDGRVYENTLSGGQWAGWAVVEPQPKIIEAPSAIVLNDVVYLLLVRDGDRRLVMSTKSVRSPGGTWSAPSEVPGGLTFYHSVALARSTAGALAVYGVESAATTSGRVVSNVFTAARPQGVTATWSGWAPVPEKPGESVTATSAPAAALDSLFVMSGARLFGRQMP